jgi:PLU-1-like protein
VTHGKVSTLAAEMAQRVRQHKRRKEMPANTCGILWRQYCEQSTTLNTMTGDYRTSQARSCVDQGIHANKKGSSNAIKFAILDPSDMEVYKETWKAIFELGQAIVEQLTKAISNSDVPPSKLSLLLSFLNNAYQVRPIPEDIFRAGGLATDINHCFQTIAEYADKARKMQAKLIDVLYETNHEGVEWEAVQKLLDQQACRGFPVELDDAKEVSHQLELATNWQERLDALVGENELCLSDLESLAQEGRSFTFRSKSLVCLEDRIQQAYQLRDRILEWRKVCFSNLCWKFGVAAFRK